MGRRRKNSGLGLILVAVFVIFGMLLSTFIDFKYTLILSAVLSVVLIATVYWLWYRAKIKEVKTKLGLVENGIYEIVTNNGKTYKNLVFQEIYFGNKTFNGRISIRFIRKTDYRGSSIDRDMCFKYLDIWMCTRLDASEVADSSA